MDEELSRRHCQPCEGGTPALSADEARRLLAHLPNWTMSEDGAAIEREFGFKNYYRTIAFVNAIAWIAHRENHHPDLHVGYNRCRVHYSTHAIGGLSENDFICAAKLDALIDAGA